MDDNIRIAICFFGQPRLVQEGYQIISKLIKQAKHVDVFVHTWWDPNNVGGQYQRSPWRSISEKEITIKENTIDMIRELYHPKRLEYEAPRQFNREIEILKETAMYKNTPDAMKHNLSNTMSNLCSKYTVSKLFASYCNETNTKYNIVISSRFDMLCDIHIDLLSCKTDKIYTFPTTNRFYLTDFFLIFTSMELFMHYSMVFQNCKTIGESADCLQLSNQFGVQFQYNIEELITLNLGLYYTEPRIRELVIFTKDIPNFI
jgi:hypothetical protein